MTRINTNVGSLVGRNNLVRANESLSQSLTRLSTGLRINTGADDPAGLIASENLRSDITSINAALTNTDRASQVIATADSSLGQVSSLLNDIRGLVTESANAGALSDEQIAANQLQVDSSLEALNRIAQTTTFQGRRLLDGSLDFTTSATNNFTELSNLNIDQANLGASGSVSLDIDVTTAATQASLNIGGIAPGVAGTNSSGSISFEDTAVNGTGTATFDVETAAAVAGTGTANFTVETADSQQGIADLDITAQANGSLTVAGQTINITALEGGTAADAEGNDLGTFTLALGGSSAGAYNATTDTLAVGVAGASGVATVQDVIDEINNGTAFTATLAGGSNGSQTIVTGDLAGTTATAAGGGSQTIALTAVADGPADGAEISAANSPTVSVLLNQGGTSAAYNATTNTLTVSLTQAAGTATLADVASAINAAGEFTVDSSGVADTTATIGATGAGAASLTTTTDGVDATSNATTFSITTVADGNQDFNLQIATAAASSITDTSAADGVLAQIDGNATTGYTVTIADDATTNLTALAAALQTQIGEAASISYSGGAADVYDASRSADSLPGGIVSVTGSTAAVTAQRTIDITVDPATFGADPNLNFTFVNGPIADAGVDAIAEAVSGGYQITIDNDGTPGGVTFGDIATAISGITGITANAGADAGLTYDPNNVAASTGNTSTTGGFVAGTDIITITADTADAAFDGTVTFATSASITAGAVDVQVDGSNNLTVTVNNAASYNIADIASAINSQSGYTASVTQANGSGTFDASNSDDDTTAVTSALTGGAAATGGLAQDAVIELAGLLGSEVFNLQAGTDVSTLIEQINLVSDATGVEAAAGADGQSIDISSTSYGSSAVVELDVRSEATGGTFTAAVGSGSRATGSDIVATVNGVAANGDGNSLSINTATLDLSTSVTAGFTGTVEFDITGGGALFQLGPDVVSNQQARLGIGSVNTAALGGVSGSLFQLQSGGTADLTTDATTAAAIVEEAIDQVTSLRGRLGAFQRTTLETNKNALNDTLANLTEAESSIRDADFAAETAQLTRSQILVQSGTRVLAIANQNPQNVLGLLG
ncbi:MAG: flagellin [Planctomycetota bacterium]